MNNLFQSSIPADLLSTDSSAGIKALEASGMTGVSVSAEVPADFGRKILVAGAPSFPIGVAFMLAKPTRVNGKDRTGRALEYDAFTILLETGEERIVAVSSFLNPWFSQEKDMTPAQLTMFEGYDKSLKTIDKFYRDNDNSSIINSKASGFELQLSLADRTARFAGVNITEASEQFDFKYIDKDTKKEETGRQRLTAFSAKTSAKDIEAFVKKVKAARKA